MFSALKRARATLASKDPAGSGHHEPPPEPGSPEEREPVRKLTEAYAAGDVDAVIRLMTDDVWLTMPPDPFEYQGRDLAGRGLAMLFGTGARSRIEPTRANGQLAFGVYTRDPDTGVLHAGSMLVLGLAGDRISSITRFDKGNLIRFGLPPSSMPDPTRRGRSGHGIPARPPQTAGSERINQGPLSVARRCAFGRSSGDAPPSSGWLRAGSSRVGSRRVPGSYFSRAKARQCGGCRRGRDGDAPTARS